MVPKPRDWFGGAVLEIAMMLAEEWPGKMKERHIVGI
jgi:hypothetical protein